jgi:predicted dehydrogenase
MGAQHLEVLTRRPDVRVTGVSDRDAARADGVAGRIGATKYGSLEELLDRGRPDAVWICTPPKTHREMALGALQRGVNVYLEKPIARTVDDGAAIVAAAEASSAVCAIGYQWHALDLVERMGAELEGQTVGLAVAISVGPTQERPWFIRRAEGGGNILERGSHQVDLVRAVAGEVDAVQVAPSAVPLARASTPDKGDIEDAAGTLLRLRDGGVAVTVVGWLKDGQPGRYSLEVAAGDATLRLNLDPDFTLEGTSRGRTIHAQAAEPPLEASIGRFLDAVRTGDRDRVACPPPNALRTLAVVAAIERALGSGLQVAVELVPA